jgi:hypothetical protein
MHLFGDKHMETMLKVWQPGLKIIMANLEEMHLEIEL